MFKEDDLSCTICENVFADPRMFPCGHSFCQKCIRDWLEHSSACPICRRLLEMPKNFVLAGLVDEFKKQLNVSAKVAAASGTSAVASGLSAAASGMIVLSHEVQLQGWVTCVTVCSDTSEFRSDLKGNVVPANSGGASSAALPQPCLVAAIMGQSYLTVLSVDGTVRLRSNTEGISWVDGILGLHGDRQHLFIAMGFAVAVTDLSGREIRRICPDTAGFRKFTGICGNAASVFVSSGGNRIAAISKETGAIQSVIQLHQLPNAELGSLAMHGSCILAADVKHEQLYKVHTDTQQVVATHPTQRAGLVRFELPWDVAVDSRGRVFVSESRGHSVRAVAADNGSLLWTLGRPGERGSGDDRLGEPAGLTVVSGGACEQLVVADFSNWRLLVFNLH